MPAEFATILPSNSTPLERAIEQTSGERWGDVDVDVIRRFKDPHTCPPHLLNFLAFERSVDIWDDKWDELKKRAVIASAPADHRLKGTLAGTRRYLEIAGAEIKQVVTRPQGFVLARRSTKEEMDAWVARHPKLKISLARYQGRAPRRAGIYIGRSAIGHTGLKVNAGPALARRVATLEHKGVSQDLRLSGVTAEIEERAGVRFERVVIPGRLPRGLVMNRRGAIGRSPIGETGKRAKVFTYALDQAYDHRSSVLWLDTLSVGFVPRDTRYRRESSNGSIGRRLASGRAIGRTAITRDRSKRLLADVLYLYDPDAAPLRRRGRSFIGRSRLGMPAHRADLLVDRKSRLRRNSGSVVGQGEVGRFLMRHHDASRSKFLLAAIASSKRLSDQVLVSFRTRRQRTLGDGIPLDGSVRLGGTIPNSI
jgi:phage tail P2-like protein